MYCPFLQDERILTLYAFHRLDIVLNEQEFYITRWLECLEKNRNWFRKPLTSIVQLLYLRSNELQTTALPVLLLQQESPHFRVILSQALLTGPGAIFIRSAGGSVGLLQTHTEADRGPLAQGLQNSKNNSEQKGEHKMIGDHIRQIVKH